MADTVDTTDKPTPQKRATRQGGRATLFPPEEARQRFLQDFAQYGNVTRACQFARINRDTAYRWREEDESFRQAWEQARDDAADTLEQEAWRRAVKGVKKPVYQGGELVGEIQEYSDTLLIFLMKAANPAKYRESVKQEHTGEIRISISRRRSSSGDGSDEVEEQ